MTSRAGVYQRSRATPIGAEARGHRSCWRACSSVAESAKSDGTWELPNGDLAGTRAAADASIDAGNVAELEVRWRYAFTAKPNYTGTFASTPVADDETVYVQDLQSNVHALDRATGKLRWVHRFRALNEGPNGLAVDSRRVYGATDSDAFALSAATGRQLWSRHLTSATEQFVDIAPVVWEGLVFTSTVGFPPGGRGAIYALDAATGAVRWKFVTIRDPWRYPLEAGGGGLWYPVSVDAEGRLYAGNSNPQPWGGSPERPNGGAFPGPVLYTNSLLVLDARSGRLLWHDQVTPHDIRDYDFEATPILATVEGEELVFGAGKAGAGDRLGPRDAAAALGDGGRSAPQRPRPAAAPAGDRLPGPVRRGSDADGLRRGPAVRPGRRPVRVGERHGPPGADDRRPVARARAGSSPSTLRPGAPSGSGGCRRPTSAARRSRTTSSSRPPSTGPRTRSRRRTGSSPGARGCGPGSTRAPP